LTDLIVQADNVALPTLAAAHHADDRPQAMQQSTAVTWVLGTQQQTRSSSSMQRPV